MKSPVTELGVTACGIYVVAIFVYFVGLVLLISSGSLETRLAVWSGMNTLAFAFAFVGLLLMSIVIAIKVGVFKN